MRKCKIGTIPEDWCRAFSGCLSWSEIKDMQLDGWEIAEPHGLRSACCDDCEHRADYHQYAWRNLKTGKIYYPKPQEVKKMDNNTEAKTKVCSICGQEKPVEEYYKKSSTTDGLDTRCKECFKAQMKHARSKLKEAVKKTAKKAANKATTRRQKPYSTNVAFNAILKRMGEIHDKKRADYASNDDALGNFREANKLGISTLQSVMIRLTDKYTRACNLTRKGTAEVKDETLKDTLIDLANYAVLALLAMDDDEEDINVID
jgi:hypothetical protein